MRDTRLTSVVRRDGGKKSSRLNLGSLLSASCSIRKNSSRCSLRLPPVMARAAESKRNRDIHRVRFTGAAPAPAAATLEEVRLEHVRDMASLELEAPGLRALHVADCYRLASDEAAVAISAPMLETLACADMCRPERLRFDGAETVWRLDKIFLWSHGHPAGYSNAGAVWLLRNCTAAHSLGVHISPPVVCIYIYSELGL